MEFLKMQLDKNYTLNCNHRLNLNMVKSPTISGGMPPPQLCRIGKPKPTPTPHSPTKLTLYVKAIKDVTTTSYYDVVVAIESFCYRIDVLFT